MAPKRSGVLSIHELPVWADTGPAQVRPPLNLIRELRTYPYIGPARCFDPRLNSVITIIKGDITRLAVDAIVNAASVSLGSGGGGIDGAIRSAAGPGLSKELTGKRCERGQVVASGGYNLPAKHILHTVAPHGSTEGGNELMRGCYEGCLSRVSSMGLKSVAFCCLGNGIFKFDTTRGAQIAFSTAREWLEQHGADVVNRIVFCTFSDADYYVYTHVAPHYFPLEDVGEISLPLPESAAVSASVVVPDADSTIDKSPKVEVEQRAARVLEECRRCGIDGDGKISVADLSRVLQALGSETTTESVDKILQDTSLAKDDVLDIKDLLALFCQPKVDPLRLPVSAGEPPGETADGGDSTPEPR